MRKLKYLAAGAMISFSALISGGSAIAVFAIGAWALLCSTGLAIATVHCRGRSCAVFANLAIFAGLAGAGAIVGELTTTTNVASPTSFTLRDLLFGAAYLFLTLAIYLVYRLRTTDKNMDAWLDAVAATVAMLLILWTSISFDLFSPENAVSVTDVALFGYDQVLLFATAGLLVRIAATDQSRSTSLRLVSAAAVVVLVGQVAELVAIVTSVPSFIALAFLPIGLGLALSATQHGPVFEPDSTALVETDRLGYLRLAATAATIGAPAIIVTFHPPETPTERILTIALTGIIVAAVMTRIVRLFTSQRSAAQMESRFASSISYLSTLECPSDIRASLPGQVAFIFDDVSTLGWVTGDAADGIELSPALVAPSDTTTHAQLSPSTSDPVRQRVFVSLIREAGGLASIRSATLEKTQRDHEIQLRKATEASERRWRGLVQHSPTGVILLDNELRVVFTSGAVKAMLGHDEESYIGHTLEWVAHSADWAEALAIVLDLLESDPGGTAIFDIRAFDADISTHILSIVATDMRHVDDIAGIVLNVADLTETRMLESRVHHVANNDPLTLLPNRSAFIDEVSAVLQRSSITDESTAVAVLNVDEFRVINEGYGTELGDRVLVEIALRIRQSVQANDTVARLGGDEFGVLLAAGCTESEAEMSINAILETLNRPLRIDSQTLSISASAGMAVDHQEDTTASSMIRRASTALDSAKESQRGAVVLFNDEMGANVAERAEIRDLLRDALRDRQLRLAYQPIVNMTTGAIVSLEALARWTHPTRGPISPGVFIPIAESAKLINQLGEWALTTACEQIRSWLDAGLTDFSVSVNLSGRQLLEPDIIERIDTIITDSQIPHEFVTLEITESVLIDDTDLIAQRISEIRQLGVGLSIDDFGTGYSSLSYLRRYEFDVLKIDRSFVIPLGNGVDQRDRSIVKNMISLAQDLGAITVAEGIEEESELNVLRALGCDRAQGYLFFKPLEAEDATEALFDAVADRHRRAA